MNTLSELDRLVILNVQAGLDFNEENKKLANKYPIVCPFLSDTKMKEERRFQNNGKHVEQFSAFAECVGPRCMAFDQATCTCRKM